MKKSLFISLAVLMLTPALFGQTGKISGKVIDANDEPLYGVNVTIEKQDDDFTTGGITDSEGKFSFE
ncbi:MAG: carboxypeptidase-like regulatory domain-containing protein, partial [Bacteroidales bacterium]